MKYLKEYNTFGEFNKDILKSILHILDPLKDIFDIKIASPSEHWIRVVIGNENSDIIDITPYREELQEMIDFLLDDRNNFIVNIDAWRHTNDNAIDTDGNEKLDDVLNRSKGKASIYTFDFVEKDKRWW